MIACKKSPTTEKVDPNAQPTQIEQPQPTPPQTPAVVRNDVPIAADLIKIETMEEFLGLKSGTIYDVTKNLNPANKNNNSIFYKIEDPDLGNAAVMLQVSKNPLPDEITDYEFASYYINNKINEGERSVNNPEAPIKFEDWDMGVSGAYNKDLGKYYWRDENSVIYLFATNVTLPFETQFKAAEKVAKMITPE